MWTGLHWEAHYQVSYPALATFPLNVLISVKGRHFTGLFFFQVPFGLQILKVLLLVLLKGLLL